MPNPETDDYAYLIFHEIPIIDVRAPAEFSRGASPSAVNLPILDDAERKEVGIAFKEHGQDAAISKGWELVGDSNRTRKTNSWKRFAENRPDAVVCCWRGGLRSQITQQWLAEQGIDLPRVKGGSKALRQYCLSVLESSSSRSLVVLAGPTGSGKTQLIRDLKPSIDLENLANHRGSAFGRMSSPQPPPITFEFELTAQLLQKESEGSLLVEDESSMIGALKVPDPFYAAMSNAPLVLLHVPLEERVALTYDSYVLDSNQESLVAGLGRIKKRLGGKRFNEILDCMNLAYSTHERVDHLRWIELLLSHYYDPMYEYQLDKKRDRIEFEGEVSDVLSFLDRSYGIN